MRIFLAALIALLLGLNFLLWMSDDRGIRQVRSLQAMIDAQRTENASMADRNKALEAEVKDLREGLSAIEERARAELGMVGRDETFYRILDEPPTAPPPGQEYTKPGKAVSARPGAPGAPALKPGLPRGAIPLPDATKPAPRNPHNSKKPAARAEPDSVPDDAIEGDGDGGPAVGPD
ncbi:FtsB family cell division protein [Plasticicumulans acidivorans]|uniref:Cell division protein FtsB n=1 Tax=Plasticicumulans acidivorans TaxID=886464 RepID=A0A317MX77_9GAMM|nr:septum formation initiator family protein [Plasticicumulans acidivorans]PWV63496.1 cell division protein FtsB [Plasticicumulans acidivorans]